MILPTDLCRARVLEVPEFDVAIADRHEIRSILGERDGLHFGRHFVGRHLDPAAPVPHVDYHVVLRSHRNDVLVVRRECLQM